MTRAMPVKFRWSILQRDGFRCAYCGRKSSEDGVKLEVDHIVAWADGGTDDPENLTTACEDCNRGKSDLPLLVASPDMPAGLCCPTRLRIATIALRHGMSYRQAWAGPTSTQLPPPDRRDEAWVERVAADAERFDRWLVNAMAAALDRPEEPIAPFA